MILNPIFNIYYALIFFIVGVAEFYRFMKKNKLEISLDNDFVIQTQSTFHNIWEKRDKDKRPEKPVRHDRFLRGGAEEQPDSFSSQKDSDCKDDDNISSSTGGSDSKTKETQFFRRNPLITETQALYQTSYILSDETNNRVNKLNFYLELFITFSVLLSSFLIITIEKDWWGGYLTSPSDSLSFQQYWGSIYHRTYEPAKPNPAYVVENTIRLMFVGISIAFFMEMILLEIVQSLFTAFYIGYWKIYHCYQATLKFLAKFSFGPKMGGDPIIPISNQ